MTDLQIRGKKIALLDSDDNIIYTLPDSAGPIGNAIISDGAGRLNFGGINLDAVLAAGDSSARTMNVDNLEADTANVGIFVSTGLRDFQGQFEGYVMGGRSNDPSVAPPSSTTEVNVIDKFPFASESTVTDVGDLTITRYSISDGVNSTNHGYGAGGSAPTSMNTIDKFAFGSTGNATDVGDLTYASAYARGHSTPSEGFVSVGRNFSPNIDTIQKWPFATDANATDVGQLLINRILTIGSCTSPTHGYVAGGGNNGGPTPSPFSPFGPAAPNDAQNIEKFPFAISSGTSTEVGDLFLFGKRVLRDGTAFSSPAGEGVLISGSFYGPPFGTQSLVQKFPFASDVNATEVGSLQTDRQYTGAASISSSTHGYAIGGNDFSTPLTEQPQPGYSHVGDIHRFPFSSLTENTVVGDIGLERSQGGGVSL